MPSLVLQKIDNRLAALFGERGIGLHGRLDEPDAGVIAAIEKQPAGAETGGGMARIASQPIPLEGGFVSAVLFQQRAVLEHLLCCWRSDPVEHGKARTPLAHLVVPPAPVGTAVVHPFPGESLGNFDLLRPEELVRR